MIKRGPFLKALIESSPEKAENKKLAKEKETKNELAEFIEI
jgi:hypothetical protein